MCLNVFKCVCVSNVFQMCFKCVQMCLTHIWNHPFSERIVLIPWHWYVSICFKYSKPEFWRKDYRYAFTTHFAQTKAMASIKDYRKIMDGLDGWNEASGFVRPADVERWNTNDQITLKTFPTLGMGIRNNIHPRLIYTHVTHGHPTCFLFPETIASKLLSKYM